MDTMNAIEQPICQLNVIHLTTYKIRHSYFHSDRTCDVIPLEKVTIALK